MEDYEGKLLEEIAADVRSNAELVEKMVNQENDALRNDQVRFYKEGLLKETSTYLEGELKEARLYAATKSSHDKLDTKKKLLELRGNFVNELMNEVTDELKKFVKSDEYKDYLLKNLKKIETKDNGYFVVRENDMDLMKELCKQLNMNQEIRKGYFAIGGFRFVDEENRYEYSCTLEEKRAEQFAWFRNNSGFKVVESEDE
jgi:vacuolar-type H+-ATPase subunit E/Vma4